MSALMTSRLVTTKGTLLAWWPPLWYTSHCWEELKDVGNTGDTGKARCQELPLHALIWSEEQCLYGLYTRVS